MSTYRERREARAERLDEWAEKRAETAQATLDHNREHYRGDIAFLTQPGHIPERARVIAQDDRAHESLAKASGMSRRADGIRAQLETSIYDDDPDAVERLTERVADLEAQREQFKAHNKEHRGDKLCPCPSDCDCRSRFPRVCDCRKHPLPAYVLANLGGNIKRNRDRLARLTREREQRAAGIRPPARLLSLKYAGTCDTCGASLDQGTTAYYRRTGRSVTCVPCETGGAAA